MQFLTSEFLIEHQKELANTGGGLRDLGALESAVMGIKNGYYEDIFEAAAALWLGIVINHPFVDGNKRMATVAMLEFLEINDIETTFDTEELAYIVVDIAQGKYGKAQIREIILANIA